MSAPPTEIPDCKLSEQDSALIGLAYLCSLALTHRLQKVADNGLNLVETAGEEMVRAFDPVQALRLGEGIEQGLQLRARAILVFPALNDELGLGDASQKTE